MRKDEKDIGKEAQDILSLFTGDDMLDLYTYFDLFTKTLDKLDDTSTEEERAMHFSVCAYALAMLAKNHTKTFKKIYSRHQTFCDDCMKLGAIDD